jgi:hypothetical protein
MVTQARSGVRFTTAMPWVTTTGPSELPDVA